MSTTLENSYALLIGVGNDLPITVYDAQSIYDILIDPELSGYNKENITLLVEKDASRIKILEALDVLKAKTNKESSVLIYYSGHGGYYEPWDQYYLVPNNFDGDNHEETWVSSQELKEKLSVLDTDKLIFLLDSCHAAGMTKAVAAIDEPPKPSTDLKKANEFVQKIDAGTGMSILSSCRENQLSWILENDSNSLFTKCLIEVLKGKHKTNFTEEHIRISEVVAYIFKKVPERKPIQTPYANLVLHEDFILSNVPSGIRKGIPTLVKETMMVDFIQDEIDECYLRIKKLMEKKKSWIREYDIASDTGKKYTLEQEMLQQDELISELIVKIRDLKSSLDN